MKNMSKPKISKGYRKFLRLRKAEIRKNISDPVEQEKKLKELYVDFKK